MLHALIYPQNKSQSNMISKAVLHKAQGEFERCHEIGITKVSGRKVDTDLPSIPGESKKFTGLARCEIKSMRPIFKTKLLI